MVHALRLRVRRMRRVMTENEILRFIFSPFLLFWVIFRYGTLCCGGGQANWGLSWY